MGKIRLRAGFEHATGGLHIGSAHQPSYGSVPLPCNVAFFARQARNQGYKSQHPKTLHARQSVPRIVTKQPHILGRRKKKKKKKSLQRRKIQIPGDRSLAPTCSVPRTSQPFEKCRWTRPTAASCFNQSQVADRDTTEKRTQSRVNHPPSIGCSAAAAVELEHAHART